MSSPGAWNRMEYRPLEGFVFAVTPFNFTAIGGNLPTAPALLGNTVVWKPAGTAMLSAYYTCGSSQEAGLPDGVINLVYGRGQEIGDAALASRDLAGVHFTGSHRRSSSRCGRRSARTSSRLPQLPADRRRDGRQGLHRRPPDGERRRGRHGDRPRLASSTRARSARPPRRVYAPANIWPELKERLVEQVGELKVGDVSDFSNFMGAVIDASSFKTQKERSRRPSKDAKSKVLVGGGVDDSEGFFVEPTVIETEDPGFRLLRDELFGPVVTTYVYPVTKWEDTLELIDRTAPYGLTGAIFSDDRHAVSRPGQAPLRGREPLRQRQADRRGRRPAALRRLTRLGDERQGGVHVEPHPLGQPAHDQGDLPSADGLPLPLHGLGRVRGRHLASLTASTLRIESTTPARRRTARACCDVRASSSAWRTAGTLLEGDAPVAP